MRLSLPRFQKQKAKRGNTIPEYRLVLVSPRPVDLYPPVAAHAMALAKRGFAVTLLTSPMPGKTKVEFNHPSIEVASYLSSDVRGLVRKIGLLQMMLRLSLIRLISPKRVMEIAYDPIGIWISRKSVGYVDYKVHHFHEILFQEKSSRLEHFARSVMARADLVTVADHGRLRLMSRNDPAPRRATTIRNFPLSTQARTSVNKRRARFSAVYFGAMGHSQCLDTIVQSIKDWPKEVSLDLYGEPSENFENNLKQIALDFGVEDRLSFKGWLGVGSLLETVSTYHIGFSMLRPLNDNWRFSAGASNKRFHLMCAGVPQISDNGIGVKELVECNGVGVCVDHSDANAIAAAVNAYYCDPERVAIEGERGRKLVLGELNMENEIEQLIDYIQVSAEH